MKPVIVFGAFLLVVASVSAQTHTAAQDEGSRSPVSSSAAAPVAKGSSHKTFAASIEVANIPANVSIMTGALDRLADRAHYNFSVPSTILIPTNEAWFKVLESAGLSQATLQQLAAPQQQLLRNSSLTSLHDKALVDVLGSEDDLNATAVQQLTDDKEQLLLGAALALLLHHDMPRVTLTTANLTDGMSLPTSLKGAGIFDVRVDATTGNISFHGLTNKTDPAANSTTSSRNYATVLYPDIPVVGSSGVVMHIVDTVLEPPLAALANAAVDFALGVPPEPTELLTPSGPVVELVEQGTGPVIRIPLAGQGGGDRTATP